MAASARAGRGRGPSALGYLAPASAAPPSYVALGDSYSSGVGTRSYLNDGTSCQRSTYAYPSLVAASRGYALTFKACSGATVSDVTHRKPGALGTSTSFVTISVGGNEAGQRELPPPPHRPGLKPRIPGERPAALSRARG